MRNTLNAAKKTLRYIWLHILLWDANAEDSATAGKLDSDEIDEDEYQERRRKTNGYRQRVNLEIQRIKREKQEAALAALRLKEKKLEERLARIRASL